jgi:hypothetical protein
MRALCLNSAYCLVHRWCHQMPSFTHSDTIPTHTVNMTSLLVSGRDECPHFTKDNDFPANRIPKANWALRSHLLAVMRELEPREVMEWSVCVCVCVCVCVWSTNVIWLLTLSNQGWKLTSNVSILRHTNIPCAKISFCEQQKFILFFSDNKKIVALMKASNF